MSLELQGFSVQRGGVALFAPLDLQVAGGAVAVVMGVSGVGKSTLLDAVGGHLAHGFCCTGRVLVAGRDVSALPAEARRIGVMFQDALLFAHLSLGDNLAFGLAAARLGRTARRAAVEAALTQAGLDGMYLRDPATLSGGQRARAALMRALLAEPRVLLLDEPFSKLDAGLRAEMRRFVFAHVKARGIATLMVTHDPADAVEAGGMVVEL